MSRRNSKPLAGWAEDRDQDAAQRIAEKASEGAARQAASYQTKPLTANHELYLREIPARTVTFCLGPAGTGKTQLACRAAGELLRAGRVDGLVLTRPLVPCGTDLGALPGDVDDKTAPYLAPLVACLKAVLGEDYDRLRRTEVIKVVPLELMRGFTFHRSFVLADEMQNASLEQLRMLLTRVGEGARFVVAGDVRQTDLRGAGALEAAAAALGGHPEIATVRLGPRDVLRPAIVQWIDDRLADLAAP